VLHASVNVRQRGTLARLALLLLLLLSLLLQRLLHVTLLLLLQRLILLLLVLLIFYVVPARDHKVHTQGSQISSHHTLLLL
jgi:hypothetical protein